MSNSLDASFNTNTLQASSNSTLPMINISSLASSRVNIGALSKMNNQFNEENQIEVLNYLQHLKQPEHAQYSSLGVKGRTIIPNADLSMENTPISLRVKKI